MTIRKAIKFLEREKENRDKYNVDNEEFDEGFECAVDMDIEILKKVEKHILKILANEKESTISFRVFNEILGMEKEELPPKKGYGFRHYIRDKKRNSTMIDWRNKL